ncbi:MAG: TVP38/TMEM64 family protein [Bdellovibrionales bacterium]|nr:TVP38/TMEM64 family protein [Bdellovibrionales bacterium]
MEKTDPIRNIRNPAAFLGAFFLFLAIGLVAYLSYLPDLLSRISVMQNWVQANWVESTVAFVLGYTIISFLAVFPAAVFLNLLAGMFFGKWIGPILVAFGSTAGATLAFLLARRFLKAWILAKWGKQIDPILHEAKLHGGKYLFSARFIPFIPFWSINWAFGMTQMRVAPFMGITFLAMLPASFFYSWGGSVLAPGSGTQTTSAWEWILSLVLAAIPLAVRLYEKKRKRSH